MYVYIDSHSGKLSSIKIKLVICYQCRMLIGTINQAQFISQYHVLFHRCTHTHTIRKINEIIRLNDVTQYSHQLNEATTHSLENNLLTEYISCDGECL